MNQTADTPAQSTPPRSDDYLPAAIQRAVVRHGLKHPLTIYPIALGVSAGVVGGLFNLPGLLMAALGLGLVGPLWGVAQVFFRHDVLGSRYLGTLHRRQKRYEAFLVDQIESGLEQCSRIEELHAKATTGIAQLKSIRVKLANVQELLDMKLRPNEITYGRFLGASEQVSLSVLDNLNTVVSLLKSAASIETQYIHARLEQIKAAKQTGKAEADQRRSLQERLNLWDSQMQKIDQLMARNEEAMTEMERISAAVAQWQAGPKFAAGDFESAIKQLHELAVQAHEYNNI
jgi:hypothetical protein